jgi:hypothetical protein
MYETTMGSEADFKSLIRICMLPKHITYTENWVGLIYLLIFYWLLNSYNDYSGYDPTLIFTILTGVGIV